MTNPHFPRFNADGRPRVAASATPTGCDLSLSRDNSPWVVAGLGGLLPITVPNSVLETAGEHEIAASDGTPLQAVSNGSGGVRIDCASRPEFWAEVSAAPS